MAINFKHKEKPENILSKYSKLNNKFLEAFNTNNDKEGVEFININPKSNSELGRVLAPTYSVSFPTFLGRTYSVKSFMQAINTPGYPLELLRKPKLTKADLAKIPRRVAKTHLANYWALVAYALTQRVRYDKKVKAMLNKNTLEFTAYRYVQNREFFGKMISVTELDHTLGKYIAIIRYIETMIKENRFNEEDIKKFIEACKDEPEKDLLDGVALNISIVEKTDKTVESKTSDIKVVSNTLEVPEATEDEPTVSVAEPINVEDTTTEVK